MAARVELVRSGGFAGISRRWTSELGEDEAAELERVFDQVGDPSPEPGGADRFQYELTLTRDNGRTRALTVREGAIPAELGPVLERYAR